MDVSWWGLGLVTAVVAPNLLLVVAPPVDDRPAARVGLPLVVLERVGQAGCVGAFVCASGVPVHPLWAGPTTLAVVGYVALWVRYLASGRSWNALYQPAVGIPIPLAVLPVIAFSSGAIWLGSPWGAVATGVLALGHLPTSWIVAGALTRSSDSDR